MMYLSSMGYFLGSYEHRTNKSSRPCGGAHRHRFLAEESGNVDAAGNFSIQVRPILEYLQLPIPSMALT